MIMRRLLSGIVTAFLAASTMALGAAPAWADDEDDDIRVRVELSSGTVVAGGSKQVTFTITNISEHELRNPVLEFVPSSWDRAKVNFPLDEKVCNAGGWIGPGCPLTPNPLLPGRSLTYTTTLEAVPGATPGPAGTLRILVVYMSGRDPQNFATFPLAVVSGPKPDLYAYAADVPAAGVLEPGQTAPLEAAFANQGNVPATDVTVTATVPAGASFVAGQPDLDVCEFAERTVTCSFGDEVLPADKRLIPLSFTVRLDADAKRGRNLTGKVVITGRAATEAEQQRRVASAFPKALADVDLADNDDTFRIMVVAADENPGTGGGTGSGDEPTLPITGPSAGVGVAFVVIGVALLLLGRRRREGVE